MWLWLALIPAASDAVTVEDPVIADVIRMLDAGLEPQLIRDWLDSTSERPGPLSANDMIALAAAHAPNELIEYLLQRSARALGAVEAPVGAPPDTSAVKAEASSPASTESGASSCCLVDFSLEYFAPEQDVAEQASAPRGDLYLYVDGRFVGRFASRAEIAGRGPHVFKHHIAPGSHTIRLTREQHLPSKNSRAGDARDHWTTVSPSVIEFEVQPGAHWTMDIRWAQGVFSRRPPLRWRWSKNGSPVAGEEHTGAYQEEWPFLCDDVEISRNSGAISKWRATDRNRGCVTWSSLWPQDVRTSRVQILAEFEAAKFRSETGTLE